MIDINELRRLAQAAIAKMNASDPEFASSTPPLAILELLDRLEAAEKERDALLVELKEVRYGVAVAHDTIKALRAKIEAMERQEPAGYGVRYVEPANGEEDWDSIWKYRVFAEDHIKDFTQAYVDIGEPVGASTVVPLYALPGAQGEEK